MGYQESIITTENPKDFPKLVEKVKQLGRDYYEGQGCYIPFIITAKRMLDSGYYEHKKGHQFLYVVGDRYPQCDEYRFLGFPEDEEFGEGDDFDEIAFCDAMDEFDESLGFKFERVFSEELYEEEFYDKDSKIYLGMEHKYINVEEFDFGDGDKQ
jgi:hypothetical protein